MEIPERALPLVLEIGASGTVIADRAVLNQITLAEVALWTLIGYFQVYRALASCLTIVFIDVQLMVSCPDAHV